MSGQTLAEVIYRASDAYNDEGVEWENQHGSPRHEAEGQADAVAAHLAAILADQETVEAVAESLDEWLFRMHGLTSSCDHADEARAAIAVIAARIGCEVQA